MAASLAPCQELDSRGPALRSQFWEKLRSLLWDVLNWYSPLTLQLLLAGWLSALKMEAGVASHSLLCLLLHPSAPFQSRKGQKGWVLRRSAVGS